jgi:hypothetical protein
MERLPARVSVRSVKGAADQRRIAEEEEPAVGGSEHSLYGLIDILFDAGSLVNYDEDMPGVKALKSIRLIGGQAQGDPFILDDLQLGALFGQLAAQV